MTSVNLRLDPQSPRNKSPILVQDTDPSFFESPILPESTQNFSPSREEEETSETLARKLRENIQTERERFNRQCDQIKAAIEQILRETEGRGSRKG